MLRGIQIRVYPNEEQRVYIGRLLGCCRYVYNHLLAFQEKLFLEEKRVAKFSEITAFYNEEKAKNPFLREVHSKVLQQSRIDLQTAWGNYFKSIGKTSGKKANKPTYHKKGIKESCRFPVDAFIGMKGNRISIIKPLRDVHFKCSRKDERYLNRHQELVHSVTVRIAPSGRIFASVLIDDLRIKPLPEQENPKYMGIDVGLKDALTTYDGEKFEHIPNPRHLKRNEKLIKRAQRKLAHCTNGSHRYEDVRRLKAKREAKVANIRRNFLQQQSTRLVRENQGIAVEDLNVAGMMKNHKLARSIGDASWSEFVREIEYKCRWYGREFVKIDRFAASSQTCSACGFKNPAVKNLKVREWECPNCHAKHDRDENATVNIRQWGFEEQLGLSSPEVTHVDRSTLGATPAKEVV